MIDEKNENLLRTVFNPNCGFQEGLSPTVPVPTPFEVQGQGEKLLLSEDTRLAAQEMLELGLNQVGQ